MKKVLAANFMPEDLSGERALIRMLDRIYFNILQYFSEFFLSIFQHFSILFQDKSCHSPALRLPPSSHQPQTPVKRINGSVFHVDFILTVLPNILQCTFRVKFKFFNFKEHLIKFTLLPPWVHNKTLKLHTASIHLDI